VPIIKFPPQCDIQAIFNFCSSIEKCAGENQVNIDFSNMKRIEPFTIVYVAKFIRDFNRRNKMTQVSCSGYQEKTYAGNMGFFRAFGVKHGREPNCVEGNHNFVPFTILRMQTIVDQAYFDSGSEQDIIESKAKHLATVLSREEQGELNATLAFSISEIMRNVYEHSGSKIVEYCAQHWPQSNKVEIAIIDTGMGLRASLKNNPNIEIDSHADGILQALMPAISSTNSTGNNVGFGLYMINRICRKGGSITICSGNHAVKLDGAGKRNIDLEHQCRGTAVRMVLDTSHLSALGGMLDTFRNEGFEAAKQIKDTGMYSVSAASEMLSSDFNSQYS
jgi:anti-sigma regulatory factor (Ser/Thr protein kinase)